MNSFCIILYTSHTSVNFIIIHICSHVDDDVHVSCYVDALSIEEEWIMNGMLITAFIFMFNPCCIMIPIQLCKYKCSTKIFARVQMCYNYLTFMLWASLTLTFLSIIFYYTFVRILPKHMDVPCVWIMVIVIMIGLLSSFVDIWCFRIFSYSKNPFKNIWNTGCGCICKLCGKDNTEESKQTYLESFRTDSLSQSKMHRNRCKSISLIPAPLKQEQESFCE